MGRFFEALKAGVQGFKDANAPAEYSVAGRPVRCQHCGERIFAIGKALLNSRARTVFDLEWLDPGATILICAECGRIEWFAQSPDRVEEAVPRT